MANLATRIGQRLQAVKAALARGPAGLISGIYPVAHGEPPSLGTTEIVEAYNQMPWLRACASKVGDGISCLHFQLFRVRRGGRTVREASIQRAHGETRWKLLEGLGADLEEVTEHPFFDLLERPNPLMSRRSLLKITQVHLDLVGDAYWIKPRNRLGKPIGYWPVPPHWVTEHPTPSDQTFTVQWQSWKADIPARNVLWFHEASPAHPYARGSGIGWSLGDELQVDEYAAKLAVSLFYNRAMPEVVVYGLADVSQRRQLERDWNQKLQGWWRAFKPYFMTGEPKFQEFTRPTMEQLVYPALRKAQRDIIMSTWGIPPEMFGISERGTLARTNYEGAEYIYSKHVLVPRAEALRSELQSEFSREWDERGIVDYVSPVQRDKEHELNVAKAAPHALSLDEWRKRQGLPEIGGDLGRARLVPLNSYLATDPLDPEQRPQAGAGGRRAGDQPEPEPAEEGDDAA